MNKDIIGIVGMGNGGSAILETILQIPEIYIKAVYDIDPNAPGISIARANHIPIIDIQKADSISIDPEIEFVFEVTGKRIVYEGLKNSCHPSCTVIGAATTKVIFHLLDAQQTANEKLKAYKNGLELAITQRTQELEKANQQLELKIREHERLNEKLQRVNDEKTRYLLQATHQLKAPFAAIQSYTDIILGGYTGDLSPQSKDIVEKIKLRCDLLSQSIKEMLELANLKSVLPENISMTRNDLFALVQESINSVQIIAKQKDIVIQFFPHAKNCPVKCNAEQMNILFTIFLENAIHYSDKGKIISIRSQIETSDHFSLAFKDQGIGIAKAHHEKIFQEYFRTNESVKQHADGTGLGLSIAKQILDLHQFKIKVESELGKGTCFIISIPIH